MMRIITGRAKGIRLSTLEGDSTRPTAERTKEAVFSMLTGDVEGRDVLDLFSGSGQMALEALSRGAREAVMVDSSKEAAEIIRDYPEEKAEVYQPRVECEMQVSKPLFAIGIKDVDIPDCPMARMKKSAGMDILDDILFGNFKERQVINRYTLCFNLPKTLVAQGLLTQMRYGFDVTICRARGGCLARGTRYEVVKVRRPKNPLTYIGSEKGHFGKIFENFSKIFCRGIIPRKKSGFQYHDRRKLVGNPSEFRRDFVGAGDFS